MVAAALAGPAAAQTGAIQIRTAIPYGPLPAEWGDLYLPAGGGPARAAVVLIHGGGWVIGSRADYAPIAKSFAQQGLVAFSIDYRLAKAMNPVTHWPAQLVDVQLAVRFLRAHAAEFGIDPARIGALGDSAGGHLAVFLGVLHSIAPGDQAGLYPQQSPAVEAVVDEYGPMDLRNLGPLVAPVVKELFGTGEPTAADMQSTSPLPDVSAASAPMYILHGRTDALVPFSDSELLVAALREHGVPVTLVPFNGGHAFEGVPTADVLRMQGDAGAWLRQRLAR